MFDILKTDRLILRKARFDDLDLIFNNVWSDESLTKNMLWKVTTNYDDAVERMKRTIKFQSENYAYFVCLKESDEPIGFAGIYEKEPGVYEDTGICIATKYQKKGYGTRLLLSIEKCFSENRFELFTSTRSLSNIKMYERMGYNSFDTKDVDDELSFVYLEKHKNKE